MAARKPEEEQRGPLGGGGAVGAFAAWIGWWVVCAALWLWLTDTVHFHELIAGAAVAVIGATAALLVRSQRRLVLRPRPRWLLGFWRPLVSYPRDVVLVSLELMRTIGHGGRSRGRLLAVPFAPGEEDAREGARRVLMKSAGSFSPNVYVVGADDERGLLLVHEFAPRRDPARDVDPLRLR